MEKRLKSIKRIKLITFITTILMIVLVSKLGFLTIIKGAHYREVSENLSVKDIYITAPRGEIRDRNGILLAGNKPIFTLQIIKDEFRGMDRSDINKMLSEAVQILEVNGEKYVEDFPLRSNQIVYDLDSRYLNQDNSPFEEAIDIIVEHNLLEDIIDRYESSDTGYQYFPIQSIINSLEYNSIDTPFVYSPRSDNRVGIDYSDDYNITRWRRDYFIEDGLSAKESLLKLIDNDKTIIRKLLDHPVPRLFAYEAMTAKGVQGNLELKELSLSYVDDFNSIKRSLMKEYPEISMDTTALQDMASIVETIGLDRLLLDAKESETVDIIDSLDEVFKDTEFARQYKLSDKNNQFQSVEDAEMAESQVINEIVYALVDNNLTEQLLQTEGMASIAQNLLVSNGINTNISIVDGIEYTHLKELESFKERYTVDNIDDLDGVLESIKAHYNIDENTNRYEAIGVFNMYEQLNKSGQPSYMPINYSYDLQDKTVAQIGEKLNDFEGFNISVEPIRSYPKGSSTAHILGYMGKISQDYEIEKYIDDLGYMPDTIIGKTGIEEAFEKNLYGKDGYKKIQVDSRGNTSNTIDERKPVPGDNIYLSIDYNLQRRTELALEGVLRNIREGGTVYSPWGDFNTIQSKSGPYSSATSGAAVAIDIETGEVLSMASYPSYDPNLFATGISSADWNSLRPENEDNPLAPRPLLNVATQSAVQPGSTYKMITGITALEKGLDPALKINSQGYITIGDTQFGCWIWNQSGGVHGPTDLRDAIRDSCNYYFYSLALGENQRTGHKLPVKLEIEDIAEMSDRFGLGKDTGLEINIPKESTPGVPNPAEKLELQKVLLRRWVEENIDQFYIGDDLKADRENIVEEIVAMLDQDPVLDLQSVYDKLAELDLDGTKKVPGRPDTLADLIKFSYINDSRWTLADTVNVTIGQGANQYTLTQMTNSVAAMVNDGVLNELTLIDSIKSPDNKDIKFKQEPKSEHIGLEYIEGLEYIKEGMHEASYTTLNLPAFEDFPVEVALKTGTAERSGTDPDTGREYDPFAYQVAFAPAEDPKIAIGVILFQGGSGANCSPITREIVAEYMGLYREKQVNKLPIEMDIVP